MLTRLYRADSLEDAGLRPQNFPWFSTGSFTSATADRGLPHKGSPSALQEGDGGFRSQFESVQNELQQVRESAESQRRDAYNSGFDEGYRQGVAEQLAMLDGFRKQVSTALHNIELHRREVIEQADEDLVRLGVAVAEKILNRQVQIDPDALQGLVSSALSRLGGKTVHQLRIHPADRAAIEAELSSLGSRRAFQVEADDTLERGSLQLETDFGVLDYSVATQLEEIENGLVDRLRRSR